MEIICITCPNGCRLTVRSTSRGLVITGNKCPRGEAYGREEAQAPKRVVTAVVRTDSEEWPCVPVKSSGAVPKKIIGRMLKKLYSLRISLPVNSGDAIIGDFARTGIDVVFTRSVPPARKNGGV